MRFDQVVFGYTEEHKILDGISLFAKPGQKIAFVGSTGAGKTTIINLINRFYEIQSGTITYDGIDIRRNQKDDLRKSLSMVIQDTHLFTGTGSQIISVTDGLMQQRTRSGRLRKSRMLTPLSVVCPRGRHNTAQRRQQSIPGTETAACGLPGQPISGRRC